MARYTDSVCRLCRREGTKLFLKGERCYTDKCAIEKRNQPPGMHGKGFRSKHSEFGIQLREKQKVKRIYGMLEKQFRRFFATADRKKGMSGENMLMLLEKRLDNVVYRMGFASSRSQARQLVNHGHVLLNQKKAHTPSIIVQPKDVITIREKSRKHPHLNDALAIASQRPQPSWIEVDLAKFQGEVVSEPKREEITLPIQEQLIVELYSR